MDAFLNRLSYHASSYAIRSCIALTSTFLIQQGSKLLKTVEDDPMRSELSHLQRRLTRKIELISPILESIEFRYARGNSSLEAVVRIAQELRSDIELLGTRLQDAAIADESRQNGKATSSVAAAERRTKIHGIITDIKQLIIDIDDSIPLINLWVSAIGGVQTQPSPFSPSRLLQASMLVNVGDMQYILNPAQPMQIGPDFTLSIYMPFRAHASSEDPGEPYGVEEGQRKPIWQEVIHKARVRLRRVPFNDDLSGADDLASRSSHVKYAYQLQIVEDLDDGRVHTLEDRDAPPSSHDGVPLAGIRELVPVRQISKIFYADVGRILNINNDDGASSNPVLLLKRDVRAATPPTMNMNPPTDTDHGNQPRLLEDTEESIISDSTLSQGDSQDEIDCQLLQECKAAEETIPTAEKPQPTPTNSWRLPRDLDPEWIALEVFEMDDDNSSGTTDEDQPTPDEEDENDEREHRNEDLPNTALPHRLKRLSRPSVDSNLATQLNRMSIASSTSRPPSRNSGALVPDPATLDEDLLERSPFAAIHTSLSLLEMLLRLASLQEFEQATHLSIPDHVLRFYLDESASRVDA
ncbi:Ran-binding-domain-containing protein [Hypoxylon cercidicola]|nr:Ran-binding-domain-containing protein [Hypoxylon cercidicola]